MGNTNLVEEKIPIRNREDMAVKSLIEDIRKNPHIKKYVKEDEAPPVPPKKTDEFEPPEEYLTSVDATGVPIEGTDSADQPPIDGEPAGEDGAELPGEEGLLPGDEGQFDALTPEDLEIIMSKYNLMPVEGTDVLADGEEEDFFPGMDSDEFQPEPVEGSENEWIYPPMNGEEEEEENKIGEATLKFVERTMLFEDEADYNNLTAFLKSRLPKILKTEFDKDLTIQGMAPEDQTTFNDNMIRRLVGITSLWIICAGNPKIFQTVDALTAKYLDQLVIQGKKANPKGAIASLAKLGTNLAKASKGILGKIKDFFSKAKTATVDAAKSIKGDQSNIENAAKGEATPEAPAQATPQPA